MNKEIAQRLKKYNPRTLNQERQYYWDKIMREGRTDKIQTLLTRRTRTLYNIMYRKDEIQTN